MNAQWLYDTLKEALKFFELRFSDMGEVTIYIDDGGVTFTYRHRAYREDVPK